MGGAIWGSRPSHPTSDVQGRGSGRSPGLMSREGGVPYHVTYPIMHVMYQRPLQNTDACDNITFPQLCLGVVKIGPLGWGVGNGRYSRFGSGEFSGDPIPGDPKFSCLGGHHK